MDDITTDIQLNFIIPQAKGAGEESVSKKSALSRKLEWKQKRTEKRKKIEERVRKRESKNKPKKGNETKKNERESNDEKGRIEKKNKSEDKNGIIVKTYDGKFNNKQEKFKNKDGKLKNTQGNFNNNQGNFKYTQGNFKKNYQGNFNDNQGNFNYTQGNFKKNYQGNFNDNQGNFNYTQGNFRKNDQGNFNDNQGNFNDNQGNFNYTQGNFKNYQRNFKNTKKNRGKPQEPAFENNMLRGKVPQTISSMTQPQYIFHKFKELSALKCHLEADESNSNFNSFVGEQTTKSKKPKTSKTTNLDYSSKLEENISRTDNCNMPTTKEEFASFNKVDKFSGQLPKTGASGARLSGSFFRKCRKLDALENKSGNSKVPSVFVASSKVIGEDKEHRLTSNDHKTVLTSRPNKKDCDEIKSTKRLDVDDNDLLTQTEYRRGNSNEGDLRDGSLERKDKHNKDRAPMYLDKRNKLVEPIHSEIDSLTLTKSASQKRKLTVDSSNEDLGKRKRRKKGKSFSEDGELTSQEMNEIDNSSVLFTSESNDSVERENKRKSMKQVDIDGGDALIKANRKGGDLKKRGDERSKTSSLHKNKVSKKLVEQTECETDSFTRTESTFSELEPSVDGSNEDLSKRKKCEKGQRFAIDGGGDFKFRKVNEVDTSSGADTVNIKSKPRKGILRNHGGDDRGKKKYVRTVDLDSKKNHEEEENNLHDADIVQESGAVSSLFQNNPVVRSVGQRVVQPVKEKLFSKETFADLDIHKFQVSNLESLRLSRLTVVQRKAIPSLLSGRDTLVRSQTGSGKTLAYAVPIVELLQRQQPPLTRADGIRALVVLPTRELVLQTYDWFVKLVKPFMRLVPGALLGGEKRKSEKARLRKGITILMGTPGRILDHVQHTCSASLQQVQYLVLDEADCLLDMGYERDIASILRTLKSHSKSPFPVNIRIGRKKQSVNDTAKIESKEKNGTGSKPSRIVFNSDDDEEEENETEKVSGEKDVNTNDTKPDVQNRSGSNDEEDCSDYDAEVLADEVIPMMKEEKEKKTRNVDETDDSEDSEESVEDQSESEEEEDEEEDDDDDERSLRREQKVKQPAKKPGHWQSMLLSATLTPAVERLAGMVLRSPAFVDAANVEADSTDMVIPHKLLQTFMVVPAKLRLVALSGFIAWKCKFTEERKILLFCATQHMVDYLTELLTIGLGRSDDDFDEGEDAECTPRLDIEFFRLHGNMEQKERTHVFQTFRAAESGVLLCTDVAARGLDMPRVDWIVQLTAPGSVADYVHRVGRTARVGAKGSAVLFLLPSEVGLLEMLQDRRIRLQEQDMNVCLNKLLLTMRYQTHEKQYKRKEDAASSLQIMYENAVLKRKSVHNLAVKAFLSYVRFYASYPREMREVLSFKEVHKGHAAKGLGLRDPPTTISGIGRRRAQVETNKLPARRLNSKLELQHGKERPRARGQSKRPRGWSNRGDGGGGGGGGGDGKGKFFGRSEKSYTRNLILSEFSSGLDT